MTERDDLKHRLTRMLGEYAAIDAVAGHEHEMVERLVADFRDAVDAIEVDHYGNVIATRQGPSNSPSLMIAAHSDEIGGVVKAIESNGMVRFERLGGAIETLLVGRPVRIRGHRGVVGVKAGHVTPPAERLTAPPIRDLYIDLGFDRGEDVEALGIQIGDAIAYEAPMRQLANADRLSGKALDNRVSCAILVELARRLRAEPLPATVRFVVTVQEEVGLRGAKMVTARLRPTAAIVVDTMPAGGTPDLSATRDLTEEIGKGPVITMVSQGGSTGIIVHPGMRDFLLRAAAMANVPYQRGIFFGGNSDAAAVHLVGAGVPTGVVNLARRYSHSPVETLDINDAANALLLLSAAARSFSQETDLQFLNSGRG